MKEDFRSQSRKKRVSYFCGKKDTLRVIVEALQKGVDISSSLIKTNEGKHFIYLEDLRKLLDFISVTPNKKRDNMMEKIQ